MKEKKVLSITIDGSIVLVKYNNNVEFLTIMPNDRAMEELKNNVYKLLESYNFKGVKFD